MSRPIDFLQNAISASDNTRVHSNIDNLLLESEMDNQLRQYSMSQYKTPQPITGTVPDIAASPLVLTKRFGHILKEMSKGVHNRPLDFLLSKYGKLNHARIRGLIEENKSIAMDLPERAVPLEKAITKMIKIIEPNKVKHKKIINAWSQEEFDDFSSPLQKRILDLLK